jgi:gliding motility-associated-like protein
MFGRNGAAGFGAFYSGFSKTAKADISLRIIGDGVCPDTLVASGRFDGVQWYYADSLLTYGPDSFFVAYAPGLYTARGYLGVCRRADFAEDTTTAVFNSPVFPYSTVDPSCYDYSDGQILFGTPMGGLAPYQYSVNQGQSFSQNSSAQGLHAGTYQLVVRDVTGCYNRPLEVSIGQPDSLSVQLNIVKIDEPVKIGDYVLLDATPSRSVEDVQWLPAGKGIPNFLRFTATPTETTNFSVVVTDAAGCTATDMVRIILEPSIFAPNIFSPTSSNGNERFTLFSKDNLPVNWLRIYDRWGELVFENRGFLTNDLASGWDGSFRGSPLTPSVFVFMAEVEYEPGLLVRLQGDITLLR